MRRPWSSGLGSTVRVYEGEASAFKITTPDDLEARAGAAGRAVPLGRAMSPPPDPSDSRPSPTLPCHRPCPAAPRLLLPRVGIGLDVHALELGRRLVLGGVEIPHDVGLAGHSDGDALVHAIVDALLGAAARGDIGQWFPSSDQRWAGTDSTLMLQTVVETLQAEGWQLSMSTPPSSRSSLGSVRTSPPCGSG